MTQVNKQIIQGCWLSDVAQVTSRTKTSEGYLDVHATISRTGIQVYQAQEIGMQDVDPEQQVRVLRTEDEVFKPESINSFAKKPVTMGHPQTLVDSANARYHSIGLSAENVVRDGNTAKTKLLITDKDAVDSIESGKKELSCGYQADIKLESGNDEEFGQYDAIQTNIRGNHIAIVDQGRAGNTCKIADKKLINDNKGAEAMLTNVIIDGITIEVTPQGKQAIDKLQKLNDALVSDQKVSDESHKAEIEKLIADNKKITDKLQGELDGEKAKVPDSKQLDKMVADRTAVIGTAKKIVKDFDLKEKSNLDIKKEVISAKFGDLDLTDKSEDYVNGRFESIADSFTKGDDNLNNADVVTDEDDPDSDPAEKARKKMEKDTEEAFKKKDAK